MLVRISYLLLPLFRANCKDIDEILAFRIYKPPHYAYRYQPLEALNWKVANLCSQNIGPQNFSFLNILFWKILISIS